ncbi:MAG: hypothetical protein WKF35_02000 [Ferruginibacter sp.]
MNKMRIFKFLILGVIIFLFKISDIQAQVNLPLADNIGEWSEPQERFIALENSPRIKVRSKVIKHFGTTGIIEVEITNLSEKTLSSTFGLKTPRGDLNDNKIHINNSYQLSKLKPNYVVTYKMELRECLPKGRGKMNDLEKCIACQPRLLFIY